MARRRATTDEQDWIQHHTLSPINRVLAPLFARFAALKPSDKTQSARVAVGHSGHLVVGRAITPAEVLLRLNHYSRDSRVVWHADGTYHLRCAALSHLPDALLTVCAGVWITTEQTDDSACTVSETHKTVVEILCSGRMRYYPAGKASITKKGDEFAVTRIGRKPKLAVNSLRVVGDEGKRTLVVQGTGGTTTLHQWRLSILKSTDNTLLFRQRAYGAARKKFAKCTHLCQRVWARWLVGEETVAPDVCRDQQFILQLKLFLRSSVFTEHNNSSRSEIIHSLLLYYNSVSAHRLIEWDTIEYKRCSWDYELNEKINLIHVDSTDKTHSNSNTSVHC